MQRQKKFMTGNSDFLSLQAGGFYYVDKTLLIRELLDHVTYGFQRFKL